ncbi:unnamed protein product [Prunus armeniaca]
MPRDGVLVYSPQGWYHAKVVLVPILEGSPLLEKPQIDFSEEDPMNPSKWKEEHEF